MDAARLREQMIEEQLRCRDIRDPAVLAAMAQVPREAFVTEEQAPVAYQDCPLPIGEGQTISQPYIVARMAEALRLTGSQRALDIGTGCGYAAAVLSLLAAEVYTIERIAILADSARERLDRLGYRNVLVTHGDGTKGWPDAAPFQSIQVSAGCDRVPPALREQLDTGGRLVIPVGRSPLEQVLVRITRTASSTWHEEDLAMVRFVPLVQGIPGAD